MTDCLFEDDAYRERCDAVITNVTEQGLELDRTVFYPTGGGQPGDAGFLRLEDGRVLVVTNTIKSVANESIMHVTNGTLDGIAKGTKVQAELDWRRRYQHMKMHTCLHLLCALVDAPVTGCSIGTEKGRLDFDLPESGLDKENLTRALNDLIVGNHAVVAGWIDEQQLQAQPELVRTLSVGPPLGRGRVRLIHVKDVDMQPCGGTHVAGTAEIGSVRVAKIEKKSRHNRRVIIEFAPVSVG